MTTFCLLKKGIFSDWAEYTMVGDVGIHDITSATGLVRGIGMYTRSRVTFGASSKLQIYNLSAGYDLYGQDTNQLNRPYNPSVAKPVHVIWSEDGDYGEDFESAISGHPETVSFSCIYGRDGMDEADWIANDDVTVDNSDCVARTAIWRTNLYKTSNGRSRPNRVSFVSAQWLIGAVVTIAGILLFLSTLRRRSKGSAVVDTESAPLLQAL